MLPAVAVILTCPSANTMSPTVTFCAASKRAVAVAPVLRNTLLALCVSEPVPACTSMLPLPAAVLLVRMSDVSVKLTLPAPSTLMLPLALLMSALAVMSPPAPSVCTSTLPLPWALTAVSSSLALPSFSMMLPAVLRSTMAPLPPVVRMSLWLASVVAVKVAPSLPTRFTLRPTSSTITSSASSR